MTDMELKLSKLTAREKEILRLYLTGISNKEIAQQFDISESTVRRTHMVNIYRKLEIPGYCQKGRFMIVMLKDVHV